MSIEGKVANRVNIKHPGMGAHNRAKCGKCSRLIDQPKDITVGGTDGVVLYCKSYIGKPYFVYETQNGNAICYCSQKCAKKHNHRFREIK